MDIEKVGVVGCGLMGAGIAQTIAEGGYATIVRELTPELVEKGVGRIRGSLDKGVEKGKSSPAQRDQVWARIKGTTDLAELAECDLIIEAIVEVRDAKLSLFAELDRVCKPDTILATNTSSFKVADMAAQTRRPHRVVGLHYFYPALINKLLEVVRTAETPPEVADVLMNFARSTGKIPILVHDAPGFAVNRFFVPWLNEAVRLRDEGLADIPTIDAAACEAFGIGLGPFGLINATGDIAYHAAVSLGESLGEFYAPAAGLRKQFESRKPWDTTGEADATKRQVVADRLLGVTFGVAAKLVEEGVATMESADRGATVGLRWVKGPFALMNDLGLKHALVLAEAMESRWPGFVPQLLRSQRQPWVLRDVRLSIEGPLAIITMNRPEAMNALNDKVLRELKEAIAQVRDDPAVRAVIITGEGSAFVAGADIRAMMARSLIEIREFIRFGHGVLKDIERLEKPVIAAINGFALGGGLELALACDIRLASTEAQMGFPEVGLGIFPGLGGTQRTTRLIGKARTSELIFTGRQIGAEEAANMGLVNRVVAPQHLMAEARQLATRIARQAPIAVGRAKAAIHQALQVDLDAGLAFEMEAVTLTFGTEDKREGMAAFVERRRPEFKGQ